MQGGEPFSLPPECWKTFGSKTCGLRNKDESPRALSDQETCMLEPQGWGWGTPSKLGSSLIWEAYGPLTPARPLSSCNISALQISALKDPQTCSTREGEKTERSLQGKLPSRAVNSHLQQRLQLCWLPALCWLPLSARLAAGGARNSSAIPGAKEQSSV